MIAAILHLDEGASLAVEAGGQVAGGFGDRHDVGNRHPRHRRPAPTLGIQLFGIAQHAGDLWHRRERCRVDLAAQPVTMIWASGRSRRARRMVLARLALGLGRHGAGIDDDRVGHARRHWAWPRITSDS